MISLPNMNARLNSEATLRKLRREAIAQPRQRSTSDIYCVPRYPVPLTYRDPLVDVVFRAMNKARITYHEAGEKAGISPFTILNWRTTGANPSVETLRRVYKALGIKWRVWIAGVDD